MTTPTAPRVIDVELLAIDLNTCTRCVGTLGNIEAGIEAVRDVLAQTGTTVRLHKAVVQSAEEARRLRFESSPTVRIDGRDIVFETLESRCDSCTDLCGCNEGTNCRVWRYQGAEYTEAPVGLIVEALLREISAVGRPAAEERPYSLPDNLQKFFAGKEAQATGASSSSSSTDQAPCCEPAGKTSCCGPAIAVEPVPAACGCR